MAAKPARRPLAREFEIVALAANLAEIHFPQGRVEPEQLAQKEGIAFDYQPFPEESDGFLVHNAGHFFIICNSRIHPRGSPRSRFTFAHELGHYFIPTHRAQLTAGNWPTAYCRTEYSSTEVLEQEADCFAANLLLPEKAFRAAFAAEPSTGLAKVKALAAHFGSSLTATAYRVIGLDLLLPPAAVFRWNQLGEPAGRRMSDDTAQLRPEYCGLTDQPPKDSVTAQAIRELAIGHSTGRTHVMDWFPKLTGYEMGDQAILDEEVISLGGHGWLTLLSNREIQELRYGQLPQAVV